MTRRSLGNELLDVRIKREAALVSRDFGTRGEDIQLL